MRAAPSCAMLLASTPGSICWSSGRRFPQTTRPSPPRQSLAVGLPSGSCAMGHPCYSSGGMARCGRRFSPRPCLRDRWLWMGACLFPPHRPPRCGSDLTICCFPIPRLPTVSSTTSGSPSSIISRPRVAWSSSNCGIPARRPSTSVGSVSGSAIPSPWRARRSWPTPSATKTSPPGDSSASPITSPSSAVSTV